MTPGNGGYVYFAGNSRSTAGFPIEPGDYQAVNLGLSDVIYGRFNSNYELETPGTWMTYLGGTGYDYATSIAYDPGHDRIWLCGGLPSSSPANFPLISNPSCYQHTGASMGFVAFAGADDGFIDYLTHYQAVPIAEITGIDCDAFGNAYVVGWGDPDGFDPVSLSGSADYFYGGPFPYVGVNLEDGFIARFTPDADHVWETTLRGPDVEYIRGVHVDRPHGKIYVYGMTRTPNATGTVDGSTGCEQYEFPLKSGGGWYQNIKHNGTIPFWSFDALLMRFDAATLGLDWSTYMGGSGGWDNITDVISDAAGNIYATGYTDSPSYSSIPCVTSSLDMGFPSCHPGSEYFQAVYGGNTDNFMLKFDLNTAMLWATWVGGSKREKEFPTNNFFFPRLALAGHPENSVTLYASTVSGSDVLNTDPPVPMTPDADYYQQLWHADVGTGATDPADCYYGVFGTDGSPRNASYFGGVGNDWPGGVTVTGGRLYLAGGTTANVNFPLSCPPAWLGTDPYCNSTPLCGPTTADAYLAQVRSVLLNVGEGEPPSQSADGLQAYPNPTDGEIVLVDPDGLAGKQVRVLDARGRCVLQMRPQAGTKAQLDLREQADGLYLVGVIGSEVRYIRVVKE